MNPSISLLCLCIFNVCVATSSQIYASFALPVLFAALLAKARILPILKALTAVNVFIALNALSAAISGDLRLGALVFLRGNFIALFTLCLFYGSDSYRIASAFAGLKISPKFSYAVYFCAKFIGAALDDFKRIKKTLNARAFAAKTSVFSFEICANVTAILFLRSHERYSALKKTMLARNFSLAAAPEELLKIGVLDYILTALTACAILIKKGAIL